MSQTVGLLSIYDADGFRNHHHIVQYPSVTPKAIELCITITGTDNICQQTERRGELW